MNTSLANLLVGEGSAKEDEHPGDLANDLIDDLLKKHPKEGHYDSDSRDESCPARSRSKCSVDRRLEYWKDMLLQRRTLQEKLRAQTGRGPAQMLHNRPQRPEDLLEIVGIAQETNSDMTEQDVVHFSRPDTICGCVPSLHEMKVPDKIFRGFSNLALDLDSSSSTVSSEPRLTRKRSGSKAAMPDSIQPYSMTNKCGDNCIVQCVRINGIHYRPGTPEFSPIVERTFTCHPFQRHVRTVVRIENSGRVMLRCCWRRVNFFSNNGTLLKDDSENFLFDTQCFQLHIGETRDVTILYQPRKVSIVKMRWLLCTQPGIFYRRPYGLTLNIHGRCTPSMQYLEMLAVEKTRARLLSVEQRVSQSQEEKEPEKPVLCPYVREIEEREVFNILNRRYFCQTYEDLERLHAFFEKITKSSSLWNLSVECLFHHVFAVRDIEARIQLSEELNTLLDGLRNPLELPLADSDSPSLLQKRGNSGFLYVRGLLASRLDEWEQLAMELEKKSVDYMYFINSIYTLLYGMIGNTVEDIVSIIESLLESSEM